MDLSVKHRDNRMYRMNLLAQKKAQRPSSLTPKADTGCASEQPKADTGCASEQPKVDTGCVSEQPKADTVEHLKLDSSLSLCCNVEQLLQGRLDLSMIHRLNRMRRMNLLAKQRHKRPPVSNEDHVGNKRRCISTSSRRVGVTGCSPTSKCGGNSSNDAGQSFSARSTSCVSPLNLGLPEHQCKFCGALHWFEERNKKDRRAKREFVKCCQGGRIRLPMLKPAPLFLQTLLKHDRGKKSLKFRENIRLYNSLFALTSIGAKIDYEINKKPGPYIFRINGQTHHKMGSLLPLDGEHPKFAQLYVYDTQNEIDYRMQALNLAKGESRIDRDIVQGLIEMFDSENEMVKAFRMAKNRCKGIDMSSVKLKLCGTQIDLAGEYAATSCSRIEDNCEKADHHREIILELKSDGLKRISELHPSFMALQYPILFPYGEDGYSSGINYGVEAKAKEISRKHVTMREFYVFRIQQRLKEAHTLLIAGRLFQQYLVDAFSCVERQRLDYIRSNQNKLRSEIFQGIKDAVVRGDIHGSAIGKRIILPSSFTGGPRYLTQKYQDTIAICRRHGLPHLFITFTCNVYWPEIQNALAMIPGQKAEDRPDIVCRVFKMKVDKLVEDITKNEFFGETTAALYMVEFQKKGLPHVHILVWLSRDPKSSPIDEIDSMISAELPNKETEPVKYEVVSKFMMHGPCGPGNPESSCMVDGRCSKYFPIGFCDSTTIDAHGFAVYRRRDDGNYAIKKKIKLDNRFAVPHNVNLLMKYQAHINVQWCDKRMLFGGCSNSRYITEIHQFERLIVHLPLMNTVVYHEAERLDDVLMQPNITSTMFTEWMSANKVSLDARQLTYAEFPSKWIWDKTAKTWKRRKCGNSIGRVVYIHPRAGELYYLRMLLDYVKGPQNYDDIKTVNGALHPTFRSACNALGLLGDDKEWQETLNEASIWATAFELRKLFVMLVLHCEVAEPLKLLDDYWLKFADDIMHRVHSLIALPSVDIPDAQLKNLVLSELERLFNKSGSSLSEHDLPLPDKSIASDVNNRLIMEELRYDTTQLCHEHNALLKELNTKQKQIYEAVLEAVDKSDGQMFFVSGHGGTGKTYLWRTIISRLRSQGQIVLAVASSGIASVLLSGGRTAHSRFKIPLEVDEYSTCWIKKGTHLAKLVQCACLIIWDEAPMNHRNCFEALDKSLCDVLSNEVGYEHKKPFGGKVVLLGGDFRQTLPIAVGGSKAKIIDACISKSYLWERCKVFSLTENMRLARSSPNYTSCTDSDREFAEWILAVGNGVAPGIKISDDDEAVWIKIPDDLLIKNFEDPLEAMAQTIYSELHVQFHDPLYLSERAIVTPKNDTVDIINSYLLSMIPGEEQTLLSFDSVSKDSKHHGDFSVLYPPEFLNTMKFSGVPNHELKLKVGAPIMLLRNINQSLGLCNGTRLIVTHITAKVLGASVITGSHSGSKVCIPRISMQAKEGRLPFTFQRRQFPVRLCFAMTIHKSQGQTLKQVGVYLPQPVFSHGQLYVAISRVTSREGLKILIENKSSDLEGYTKNIVFREIFEGLYA
ncbi:DNA helicase [Corchorus capsularis]|uniref:ATP-dependent DNA helicase n=1 Tax=Corchorus capsularis TaxID=210143 RepID=A0A1R3GLF8_COCAP|nr:DNA helicase [Corchorus capsularis]